MRVGIAGAGIMGQLLAFFMHHAGWEVTLFDQGQSDNCSMAAAGLLTPVAELEKNDITIFQLGEAALNEHWPSILSQLKATIFFQKTGSVMVAHAQDQKELAQFIKNINTKLHDDHYYQRLDHNQLQALEPMLSKFHQGVYFPTEGQIDNQAVLKALENHLLEKEVTWIKPVTVLNVQAGSIELDKGSHSFDLSIDCRGLGAKRQCPALRGVRGELIWLHAPEVSLTRPIRFLHPRYPLYIVPRPDQCYLVGASEIESDDRSAISVRTTLELLTAAYSVHPNFSEARILKTVTQLRPTLPDHLPKITQAPRLITVNGLYRHGFLIAPTLASDIMRWIDGGMNNVQYPHLWEPIE